MRNRSKSKDSAKSAGRYDHMSAESDFYGMAPSEQPLFEDRRKLDPNHVRKTERHQAEGGRRGEGVDPREKMALVAILKSIILILFLLIAFFMLWKGVSIYEESVFRDTLGGAAESPVLQEVAQLQEFDIENQDARELFAKRIEVWKEADRLVRSTDALVLRGNLDLAIGRCQDALRSDPSHLGALGRLGELYHQKGMYAEAINAYIRMLGMDPSRRDLQEKLITTLDAYGDAKAVVFMARWYLDQNTYDGDVQRHLATGLFNLEEFEEAADAFERVLKDNHKDGVAMDRLSEAYMILERYEDALKVLDDLHEQKFRDPAYYHRIAVCHAQLGRSLEAVQVLGKSAHLFGRQLVIEWIQDPRLDPIREERSFQSYADQIGGEEYAAYLRAVEKAVGGDKKIEIKPQLEMPNPDALKQELLPTLNR